MVHRQRWQRASGELAQALEREGGEIQVHEPPSGILPVAIPVVIFGVVVITALTEQVADWWTTRQRKGLLIHVDQDGKVEIKELDVPYGQVIVIGADGKTAQFHDVSGDKLKLILDSVSKAAIPSVDSLLT